MRGLTGGAADQSGVPDGTSAGRLALAGVLPPGPVAIGLLAQVQPELLDDVQRTEM